MASQPSGGSVFFVEFFGDPWASGRFGLADLDVHVGDAVFNVWAPSCFFQFGSLLSTLLTLLLATDC